MLDRQRLRILLTDEPTDVSTLFVRNQLHLGVGIDEDDVIRPLEASELLEAGLSRDEVFQIAERNLREASSPSDIRGVDTLPGLKFVKSSDGLASSRLHILHELLDPLPYGGVIAAVPEPGQLLCVPLSSARAIDAMQALASAVGHLEATRDHLLSDQLYWHDGTRWRPVPVHHGVEDITVLPPPDFLKRMSHVAAMDLVSIAGEA